MHSCGSTRTTFVRAGSQTPSVAYISIDLLVLLELDAAEEDSEAEAEALRGFDYFVLFKNSNANEHVRMGSRRPVRAGDPAHVRA